ncbi:MAG: DUF4199 domain-containing protein [Odoribacteraceae bacterium]|jgi:hypothetical protein|nr:DUF4199 domain-containing protein [Odoribacteraceae bacterium]
MNTLDHRSLNPIATFGLLVGGSFIIASLLFILSGRDVVMNPRLNNVVSCLSIIGCFMGVKKFRDDRLAGSITYGRAFSAGLKIVLLATVLYSIYTFALYSARPELMEEYKNIMTVMIKEIYGEISLGIPAEILNETITPLVVAFSEFFRDVLLGMFFLLVIAAILRRNLPTPARPNPSDLNA